MKKRKIKIIVLLGPTASGKSDLGVSLARAVGGEIISADSRQVYRGLNVGAGKITKKEMRGVPHHLLDVVNPRTQFTAAQFKNLAGKKIREIVERGKVPIVVGGTGFYIDTLLGAIRFPNVPPNKKLRKRLQNKNARELFEMLKKIDPKRAKTIDAQNPVRLIRAIEIAKSKRNSKYSDSHSDYSDYDTLKIGLKTPDALLKKKITIRLFARIREGMIGEAKKLHAQGLSWKRMEELGLEYRILAQFLKQFPRSSASSPHWSAFQAKLEKEIWHYVKRQKRWFKRDAKIKWFMLREIKKIKKEVAQFLSYRKKKRAS